MKIGNIPASISELIAVISATSFVMSLFYEFGYFSAIGLGLIKLMSITDFITSALFWIPGMGFICALYMYIFIGAHRLDGWSKHKDLLDHPKIKKNPRIFNVCSLLTAIMFSFLFYKFNSYFSELALSLCIPALLLIAVFTNWILLHPKNPFKTFNKVTIRLVFMSILIPLFCFCLGLDFGNNTLNTENTVVLVNKKPYKFLKKIQDGVIVSDKNSTTTKFFKFQDMEYIEHTAGNISK